MQVNQVTLRKILRDIRNTDIGFCGGKATLRGLLLDIGFNLGNLTAGQCVDKMILSDSEGSYFSVSLVSNIEKCSYLGEILGNLKIIISLYFINGSY
jgi:hypothetical protein